MTRDWSTALPDWEERIMSRRSLIPPNIQLFDIEAERALRIFKRLKCPDIEGFPTYGEICDDWVFDLVKVIFGSYDAELKRRMIREFFVLIPKKNGKSSIAAAIMVTAVIMNRRPEAECLLIAPTKKIADIAFKQAQGIIRLDETLSALFHCQAHQRTITHRRSLALIIIKAADKEVITGSKSTFILIDETHVFAKIARAEDVFVEIRGSLAARPDGFLLQITTQSKDPPSGVFKAEIQIARDCRDGKLLLPVLAVLYELPKSVSKDNGWQNEAVWGLVNPNLDRSLDRQFLRDELVKAKEKGAKALALLASQHFNVEIDQGLRSDGWAGAALWPRGIDKTLTIDTLLARSEVITIGIDGGGLDDLLGVGVCGREKETKHWLGWCHAYISPEGLERRKANRAQYDDFRNDGDLSYVDQLPDDIAQLVAIVEKVVNSGLLAQAGCDAAGLGLIIDELAKIGVSEEAENLVAVRQGFGLMDAIKSTERKLADGTFRHADQPLMTWCAGNAIRQATPTGMRIVRDESGFGKIDPLMAMFNAVALMARNPVAGASVYTKDRGLLVWG